MAVAAVRRGEPFHVAAYGLASIERQAPADIHTGFSIGSCSKAFTAFLASRLVDDGVIRWDDRLRQFLPRLQFHDPWISERLTLRDVLANRTGLSRASLAEYGSDLSRADVLAWPALATPVAPTGERAWLRCRGGEQGIEAVHWHGWFGEAVFQRSSGSAASDASASSARKNEKSSA
jgi:CubicO group peptidase (beta-lactamase class C family)